MDKMEDNDLIKLFKDNIEDMEFSKFTLQRLINRRRGDGLLAGERRDEIATLEASITEVETILKGRGYSAEQIEEIKSKSVVSGQARSSGLVQRRRH
jgi:hypothetical protein